MLDAFPDEGRMILPVIEAAGAQGTAWHVMYVDPDPDKLKAMEDALPLLNVWTVAPEGRYYSQIVPASRFEMLYALRIKCAARTPGRMASFNTEW